MEVSSLPDNRQSYFLNIFNVNPQVTYSQIRRLFEGTGLGKIIPVGSNWKIYDLEFPSKKDLYKAVGRGEEKLAGRSFCVRTSLRNSKEQKTHKEYKPKIESQTKTNKPVFKKGKEEHRQKKHSLKSKGDFYQESYKNKPKGKNPRNRRPKNNYNKKEPFKKEFNNEEEPIKKKSGKKQFYDDNIFAVLQMSSDSD